MSSTALAVAVFLACLVEGVEATTIVIAAGAAREWRSAWLGTGSALMVLAAVVAALGPAVTDLPLRGLRVVVGALLLVFGLQWLRKAILRASGHKALHDEDEIYRTQLAAARAAASSHWWLVTDWYAFTLAFKGVLLEGLEVAFIVVTFGANQRDLPLASAAALAAVVVVVIAGAAARAPLSRVPENTLKLVVGIMLTSFGMFWGAEGAGAHWPGSDASLLAVLPAVALLSAVLIGLLRASAAAPAPQAQAP